MNWKKEAFANFRLYAVTDLKTEDPKILTQIEEACRGGADIVQLRSQGLSDAALCRLGEKIRQIADRYQKLFFVNDRLDIALAVAADGVHVGQDDLPIARIRSIVGYIRQLTFWIGKSTHSLKQALEAQKEGADYISVGPIFGTPTKPDYPPVGLELVRQVSERVRIPFVAIGGIDETNLAKVLEAGADRVAVVRAIFGKENVCEAARKLREQLEAEKAKRGLTPPPQTWRIRPLAENFLGSDPLRFL